MEINSNDLIVLGAVPQMSTDKIHQRSWVYDIDGVAPTICATDYKDPKRILVKEIN